MTETTCAAPRRFPNITLVLVAAFSSAATALAMTLLQSPKGQPSAAQPAAPQGIERQVEPAEPPLFWNTLTKSWMTQEQIDLMKLAYRIGFADGGEEHAELVQAVLLQETIAGHLGRIGHMSAPVGKRSYGVMQVKVSAARDVLRKFPDEFGRFRSDEELIARLLTDDEFNIRMGSKFLLRLRPHIETTEQLLVAYNIGLSASRKVEEAEKFKYTRRTRRNLERVVRPFNRRFIEEGPLQLAMGRVEAAEVTKVEERRSVSGSPRG